MKPRARSLGLALSLLLIASVAYTLGRTPKSGATTPSLATTAIGSTATPVDTPPGWRVHRSKAGYAVAVPPTWAVREDDGASGRVVTVRGPAGAEVIVWPVFTKAAPRPATAAAVLRELSAKLVPGAEWQAPQPSAVTALIYARYAQALPPGYSRRLTAGEIIFTCTLGGEPARGYYYAATALSQGAGSRLWKVEALYGYVAAGAEEGRAVAALTRMLQSARFSEQWLRMVGNVTAEAGRIANELNAYISGLIRDSYQARGGRAGTGEARDPSAEWSDAMLGITNLRDEETGNTFRVESGSSYYWVDPRGTVRGTETNTQPGVDFRQLVRVRPES